MTDQFGSKVVTRCISAAVHIAVEVEYFYFISAFDLGLYLCDLFFHAVYDFICLVFYLEYFSKVVKILIHIFYITAQFVAFDGRQGHNAVTA